MKNERGPRNYTYTPAHISIFAHSTLTRSIHVQHHTNTHTLSNGSNGLISYDDIIIIHKHPKTQTHTHTHTHTRMYLHSKRP